MSAELDQLTAQVHANTSVVQSAVALINGISDRIKAAGTDPAALQALTAKLDQQDQGLAAAVAANTPTPPADTTGGSPSTPPTQLDTTGGSASTPPSGP